MIWDIELRTSLAAIEREMAERLSIESKQVLTEIEIKVMKLSFKRTN